MFYTRTAYVEDQVSQYRERYVPLILTTSLSTLALTTADPSLIMVNGAIAGYNINLPDATTLEVGYHITIHNESTTVLRINTFGGALFLNMNVGARMVVYLKDNLTAAGLWVRAVQSSSPFTGTAPVLASYNGNAVTGRYLEIFPGQSSDTAPFYVPVNSSIVAFEFSTVGTSTATLSAYKVANLATPIYSISLAGQSTAFGTNLSVSLSMADQIAFRISAGSATKPRMAMYFTGV